MDPSTSLRGADLTGVDLTGARLREVALDGASFVGAWGTTLRIDGELDELVYNGIDLVPLWRAEMVRRHPEYALLEPTTADGYRAGWAAVSRLWDETVARASTLPEGRLHQRVAGEWSFIETLRHLVFATDAWIARVWLGQPAPWHPLGLPCDGLETDGVVPWDRDARPGLAEVLALRADRRALVTRVYDELTDADLTRLTAPVEAPGYPAPQAYDAPRVLQCILLEEWWHRQFAERDLAVLSCV